MPAGRTDGRTEWKAGGGCTSGRTFVCGGGRQVRTAEGAEGTYVAGEYYCRSDVTKSLDPVSPWPRPRPHVGPFGPIVRH